jgi:hypothetical protein
MTPEQEERLAAWLDGALQPDEAEAFAAEVAADPELAETAQAWRANDQDIAAAFTGAQRPIDEDLLKRLGLMPAPMVAANDNPRGPMLRWLAAGSALAASLAAAVVLNLGGPGAGDPLSDALDRTASLASAQLGDGRTITPTLTVRAADGRWCREFREGADLALACRKDGRWNVEARTPGAGAADTNAIAVASGADAAGLEAAYGRLKPSDPLSPADERAVLESKWK